MAGFRSVKKYTDAWAEGRSYTSHFRKAPATAGSTVCWVDYSMYGGGPPANYYASSPLVAATLTGSEGFYHGDDKAPARKYLTHFGMSGNNANNTGPRILQDYLLYYPFIDCDDLTTQTMTNTVPLPRYTDGEGLQVMAVCVSPSTGNGAFTFEYVNQAGVTKTSPPQLCQSSGNAATISTLIAGPQNGSNAFCYLPLAAGDSGVRQINSVTFSAANGGLMCLVIVKPLCTLNIREGSCAAEVELVTHIAGPPRIYDGAYLSMIHLQAVNQSGTFMTGWLNFIWDEGT